MNDDVRAAFSVAGHLHHLDVVILFTDGTTEALAYLFVADNLEQTGEPGWIDFWWGSDTVVSFRLDLIRSITRNYRRQDNS